MFFNSNLARKSQRIDVSKENKFEIVILATLMAWSTLIGSLLFSCHPKTNPKGQRSGLVGNIDSRVSTPIDV